MSSTAPRFQIPYARFARAAASAVLPILLVLYPTLLLLEDLEPGFVRSIVNPHAFLLVLLATAIIGNQGSESHVSRLWMQKPPLVVITAVIGGTWVWWRLDAGTLGIIVGLLSTIAIGVAMSAAAGAGES